MFVDDYAALGDGRGGIRAGVSEDGVHPNIAGYGVITPLARRAIVAAMAKPPAAAKD